MKKGLLFILMVGASVCLSAQEKGKTEGKAYTVETNRFGANWFISGGVGGQMYFGDNDGKADFGKRIAPALDIAVGKWFTPGIGLRVAYNGLQAKGAAPSANDLYTKGGKYSNGYYKQKWNMANFHGDVLFNLSNMFCGYNEDRLYSFIPYVGAGVALSWSEPHQQNLGINAGLINRFRVSDAWDINLELRGLLMKDAFGGTSKEGMAGVTVGVTYKFKKRGFNAVPTVPMVPESQLDDMRNRMNSLKSENESLKSKMAQDSLGNVMDQVVEVKGVKVLASAVDGVDMNGLRDLGDQLKEKLGEGVVVLASAKDGKVSLLAMATQGAMDKGAHAGNLIKAAAAIVGGGGGGRPNMAQAGGKNPDKIPEAIAKVAELVEGQLK